MAAGEQYERPNVPSLAVLAGGDAAERFKRHASTGRKPGPCLVVFREKLVDRHGDRISVEVSRAQVEKVPDWSTRSGSYPLGSGGAAMTDEELARRILLDLFPRGHWKKGAEETGIEPKTFQRIVGHGGTIKSGNWERLHRYTPFELRFQKAKQGQEPQFDRKTKELWGRLLVAYGPRNLAVLVSLLETLSARVGAEDALTAVESLAELTLQLSESASKSDVGQKSLS